MKQPAPLFLICFFAWISPGLAHAAEFTLTPKLVISEEFTDNVFETSEEKRHDFITRLLPGIAFDYKAPLADLSVSYNFDYRHYARGSRGDESTHALDSRGTVRLIDEFLYLDLSDTYSRISLDITRDTSRESLFVNQTDQNTFTASPYIRWRLAPQTALKTGYRYTNIWYEDPTAIDRVEQSALADLSYELSPKAIVSTGYIFTHQETSARDHDKHDAFMGVRYEYADRSFLNLQVGNAWIAYSDGADFSNLFWSAGITHDFDGLITRLSTTVAYVQDPLQNTVEETTHMFDIEKRFARGSTGLNLAYADYVDTVTDHLQTRRYGGTARGTYELLPDLSGNVAFTFEKYDRKDLGSYTRRIFVDSALSYQFSAHIAMALAYKYIDYRSPGIAEDNSRTNRVALEFRLTL